MPMEQIQDKNYDDNSPMKDQQINLKSSFGGSRKKNRHCRSSDRITSTPSVSLEEQADKNSSNRQYEIDKSIIVGICCMEKKLKSKPMQQILWHLASYSDMHILQFTEDIILNQSIY